MFELGLLLLAILGLGVWGIISGIRLSRRQPAKAPVSAQALSSLAQPFRRLLGEAVEIERDVTRRAASAPKPVQRSLTDLALRLRRLVERALPRARHGTELAGYLLRLDQGEPQYQQTEQTLKEIERELSEFVAVLKGLRGKVYQVLTDVSSLGLEQGLKRDLDDAVLEVAALEEAFAELNADLR